MKSTGQEYFYRHLINKRHFHGKISEKLSWWMKGHPQFLSWWWCGGRHRYRVPCQPDSNF